MRYLSLKPMGTAWNRRGFHTSHGVVAEGVGPADPGPQHARMVAATAACSLDDAAGPATAALPPPRVPEQRNSVAAEAEHGGGGDGSIGRETTLEQ